jgi:hypothetical protein
MTEKPATSYWLASDGQVSGPHSLESLILMWKQKMLLTTDSICKVGEETWVAVAEVAPSLHRASKLQTGTRFCTERVVSIVLLMWLLSLPSFFTQSEHVMEWPLVVPVVYFIGYKLNLIKFTETFSLNGAIPPYAMRKFCWKRFFTEFVYLAIMLGGLAIFFGLRALARLWIGGR